MTLNLANNEVCRIRTAIHSVIFSMKDEMNAEGTTESRKEILKSSIEMWDELVNKIIEQQRAQQ